MIIIMTTIIFRKKTGPYTKALPSLWTRNTERRQTLHLLYQKEGLFIPLYHPIISPNFKMEYNDKISFAELNTDFLLNEENLTHYINHIFSHLLSAKL